MYTPKANLETRLPVLHQLISAEPLATLVTMTSSGLLASHLPLVLDREIGNPEPGPFGTLRGHFARANPQWRDIDSSVDALAIFAGPQHYISASWYPGKLEDGEEVPTWNYVVVHAYGPLRIVEDPAWLWKHLGELTDQSEASNPAPWKVSDAPAEYIENQMRGIVGFELPIQRIEGKWKVSQNRNARDKQAVIAGLSAKNTPESLTMRDLVVERS